MSADRKPCTKCGEPPGLSPDYIEEMVAHKRMSGTDLADDSVYRQRLLACSQCGDCLGRELCRFCGCYIRFRALNARQYCPHPEGNRWHTDG